MFVSIENNEIQVLATQNHQPRDIHLLQLNPAQLDWRAPLDEGVRR